MTKCPRNLLLTKNKLTNADDFVEVSKTAVSSCDDDERFDDGTDREHIKCTTARERVGIWSQEEHACHGIARNLALTHQSFHVQVEPMLGVITDRQFPAHRHMKQCKLETLLYRS